MASAPNCEAESARAFSLFWFCRWRRLLDGSVFALMTLALPCLVCAQVQVDDGDGGTPRVGDSVAAAAAAASAAVSSSAPAVDGVGLAASAGVGGSVAAAAVAASAAVSSSAPAVDGVGLAASLGCGWQCGVGA